MAYDSIVLVKQVPDTKRVTGNAMKEDGTMNRAALPMIFNPEDLNALEMALSVKDEFGGTVAVLTMGMPGACEVLRETLYRGADRAILMTDRRMAAADTLATSYALSHAVRKAAPDCDGFDLVFCGRQAIDGDTAQVGPQTAEKLGLNQVTYVDRIRSIEGRTIEIEKSIEGGHEIVRTRLPLLLTVTGEANEPRPPRAKRLLQYRRASSRSELVSRARKAAERRGENPSDEEIRKSVEPMARKLEESGLLIAEWDVDAIGADPERCGGRGSPTKVKRIESVVLAGGELRMIEPTEDGARSLMQELVADHILG